ncbi:peptidoglycan-binding protein [Streptomyces sp. NPDC046727]|uniref:peptidoglycan-binding protein n=1 Tax=Streptomyces sp. NPDC046727 TaxID=3155373 RepID=UPI0033E47304
MSQTRTAEAAAAEDFDPLRIRPYVEVRDAGAGPGPREPRPVAPAPPAPTAEPGPPGAEPPRRRSARTVLLAAGGAGVVIVAVAGFALLSYHAPARERAAREVRESIPAATTRAPASVPAPAPPVTPASPAPSPSVPADPSPSFGSASPSPTPTPSASASRATSPTPSVTPSASPRTTPALAPVLRRGDRGPEVTELQLRLRQLNLYGDRIDDSFTLPVEDAVRNYQLARGIAADPLGEYGPATRRSLEGETTEP